MTWGMSMGAHKSGKFWPCWALHGHSVGTFASLLGMPSPTPQPPGRRRLVEHLEDHKARHDLTWQEVADSGPIPLQTLRRVRVEASPLSRDTRERLETILGWAPGSVQSVEDGGDPTPLRIPRVQEAGTLDTPLGQIVAHAVQVVGEAAEGLDNEEREELIRASEERIRSDLTVFVEAKLAAMKRRKGGM